MIGKSVITAVILMIGCNTASAAPPSLSAFMSYPFESDLTSAPKAGVIAWVCTVRGVRNVWIARAPGYSPRQITHNAEDDGQEITDLNLSPDGHYLAWVRGGDHDGNWAAEGGLAPDPAASADEPRETIWAADLTGVAAPTEVTEGDAPAVSVKGELAFVRQHQVWTAALNGKGAAKRLFFDRGKDDDLNWSPDGSALAFVSDRGDHAFIGVYRGADKPLAYLAPSTDRDGSPRWAPDGQRIAFTRRAGSGGPPESMLVEHPDPWSIWVARADGGEAHAAWRSGKTLEESFPRVAGEANLLWVAGDRVTFMSEADGWEHLYAVPAAGGDARLLTPGAFMVEHVAAAPDDHLVIYDANTGADSQDGERRHLYSVAVDGGAPSPLTAGAALQWWPVAADGSHIAYIGADARVPPEVSVAGLTGDGPRVLAGQDTNYPASALVTPTPVTFQAADGLTIHGQVFNAADVGANAAKPGVVFVHGGPPRQMLLGWHYMDYYAHAYALNQYLAARGYVVLSVNYRLGIGYGRAFRHPAHAGFRGGAEYQDVLAGGRFLQGVAGVDPARIGIWGGSYGGYLTAMALSHNSDVFKVGVDLHGVHDWSSDVGRQLAAQRPGFEKDDRDAALAVAFKASPIADLSHWTSPVLLIHGDDDRNVSFHETVDLARRLDQIGAPYEELVLPNEIHGFLRHASWMAADEATVRFLDRTLMMGPVR